MFTKEEKELILDQLTNNDVAEDQEIIDFLCEDMEPHKYVTVARIVAENRADFLTMREDGIDWDKYQDQGGVESKNMTVSGVSIGDKFIDTIHRKSKRVSTVVDFLETTSLTTGEHISFAVVAEHEFMGQIMKTYPAFSTVVINRLQGEDCQHSA